MKAGGPEAPLVSPFRLILRTARFYACGLNVVGSERTRPGTAPRAAPDRIRGLLGVGFGQLHPLVPPQVLHFMQVPLRTSV